MKKIITFLLAHFIVSLCFGQEIILPGSSSIDKSLLKPGLTTLGYFVNMDNQWVDLGTYEIETSINNGNMIINSTLYFKNSDKQWTDSSIAKASDLSPISCSSDRDKRKFSLNFSNVITGECFDKKTLKREHIKIPIKDKYFYMDTYIYIIRALPLNLGYKAIIPVYDYDAKDKSKICKVVVNDVKSDVFTSTLTGKHDVWKVFILEESTGHNFEFMIDKKNRRLWQIDYVSKGKHLISISDKEADYNPLKNKFDKNATVKLITKGTSTIAGQVFGRANKKDEDPTAIINWNPKQVAKKGTAVYLIPYSDWYKEYYKVNRNLKKDARKYNMPKEALECILVSTIYDDEGHFDFTNLLPGEYFIYCEFDFLENHHEDVVTGRIDYYQGNTYQGSQDVTQRNRWSQLENAFAEEIVKIEKDGESKVIKLKKQKMSNIF